MRKTVIISICKFGFILPFLIFFSGCIKHDVSTFEEDPYKVNSCSPLADEIPYNSLGRGKILFKRLSLDDASPFYVIDIDKKSTFGFEFVNGGAWPSYQNISPDGKSIVCSMFTVKTGVTTDLMNIDGSNCHPIEKLPFGSGYPSWSSDGSKVLFYLDDGPLYMKSPDENMSDTVLLTKFLYSDDPEWGIHPSGGFSVSQGLRIVCVSSGNKLNGILSIIPYAGKSGVSTLLEMTPRKAFESPVFSPDGQKIAFLSIDHDSLVYWDYNSVSVEIINSDGSDRNILVKVNTCKEPIYWLMHMRNRNVSLCWSPDGSKILFTAPMEQFGCHLFVINADGSGLTQVTDNINGYDVDVSWSR